MDEPSQSSPDSPSMALESYPDSVVPETELGEEGFHYLPFFPPDGHSSSLDPHVRWFVPEDSEVAETMASELEPSRSDPEAFGLDEVVEDTEFQDWEDRKSVFSACSRSGMKSKRNHSVPTEMCAESWRNPNLRAVMLALCPRIPWELPSSPPPY